MGTMGKIAATAIAGAMALAGPSVAQAATFMTFSGTSGVYGNSNHSGPNVADSFTVPTGKGWLSATISSIGSGVSNIDFSSVTLNGTPYSTVTTGFSEFRRIIRLPVDAGNQTIQVMGVSGGDGSYDGTLSFTAVPEPATWTMLILGMGAIGFAMRRRPVTRTADA